MCCALGPKGRWLPDAALWRPALHRGPPKEPPINGVVLTSSAHSFIIIVVIQQLTGCPPLTALQRGACMRRKGASRRPHVTGAVRVKGRRSDRAIWREPKGFHCASAWEGRRALQRLCLLSQVRRQTVSSISLTLILCANTGAWQYPEKGGHVLFLQHFILLSVENRRKAGRQRTQLPADQKEKTRKETTYE